MKGNLERLLKCLRGYYRLHLGLVLDTKRMPDLVRLARNGDIIEVLVPLILYLLDFHHKLLLRLTR